ncbi:hypothetical protein XI03_02190, partial [Bradyrhizobium sp. CCBAU 65884]|nr:hypothetical protein [Bradyrhizobium sp. CCBAU 65884]
MPDVKGIPLDAPLYRGSKDRGSAFLGCQAINLVFSVGHEVSYLLPKGLQLCKSCVSLHSYVILGAPIAQDGYS